MNLRPAADGSFTLLPETAELHGDQIRVEEQQGHAYLAAWDRSEDSASWRLSIPAKGLYEVKVVYSAASGESEFVVELDGQKLTGKAERTSGWYAYRHLVLGKIGFSNRGVHELTIRAHDSAHWRPVNIRSINLRIL